MIGSAVTVRVLSFARLRELLGSGEQRVTLAAPATVETLWTALIAAQPQLAPLRASTRVARNGELAADDAPLREGDELALLPPVGGG